MHKYLLNKITCEGHLPNYIYKKNYLSYLDLFVHMVYLTWKTYMTLKLSANNFKYDFYQIPPSLHVLYD